MERYVEKAKISQEGKRMVILKRVPENDQDQEVVKMLDLRDP